jgi:hypothetical protein
VTLGLAGLDRPLRPLELVRTDDGETHDGEFRKNLSPDPVWSIVT